MKTNFLGLYYYDQLVSRNWCWDETHWTGGFGIVHHSSTSGQFWLDNSSPYQGAARINTALLKHPPTQLELPFGDGPSLEGVLFSSADLPDTFQAYVRFQPVGGIPVTIGGINWGWHGKTALRPQTWSLTSAIVTGPTLDANNDSFPVWAEVYPGLN